MVTFDMVDVAVLDKNGDFCMPYEIGRLVATSELDMVGYKNDPSAAKNTIIYERTGMGQWICFREQARITIIYFIFSCDNSDFAKLGLSGV